MSTNSLVLVIIYIFIAQSQSQFALREYIVKKDLFGGFKSGEFSIYDPSGNMLLYRLESQYYITQKADLYVYPGKRLVGSIRNKWSLWRYNSDMQIYDPFFNQWISGRITQDFFAYHRYRIVYGNRRLVLDAKLFSLTTEIRDERQPNYILARARIRLSSLILPNTYDLQVYSNELPDAVYILALVAYDHHRSTGARSRNNNPSHHQ